jgi:integrase
MSLRKRGSVWWIDIATPSGERVRRSTQTDNKVQAQELHDKLKSEVWRIQRLGDRPRRLWQDAAVRWLREQVHKASLEDDKEKLRWLDRHLANRELESINRALIDAITDAKRADGCSNGTVNRTLALIRAILRKCARDWEWLDRAPAVRLLKEPTRRIRFLNRHQARTLLRELPTHLRDMATFTLATGLRAANVTGLTWEQVDLSRKLAWIHPDQAKARRAIAVPLNDTAMQVVREQRGKAPDSGVYLQGSAGQAGQQESLVQRAQARRYRGLSLARSAPHVGELARAGRNAALRVTGARGLGNREDGAPLRTPRRGTLGGVCGQHGESRHKYGTSTGFLRHTPIASGRKIRKLMVARGGIEPPTRGFSVHCPKQAKLRK